MGQTSQTKQAGISYNLCILFISKVLPCLVEQVHGARGGMCGDRAVVLPGHRAQPEHPVAPVELRRETNSQLPLLASGQHAHVKLASQHHQIGDQRTEIGQLVILEGG